MKIIKKEDNNFMTKFIKSKFVLQIVLASLITTLIVAGAVAATTIGTNVSVDGTLTVNDSGAATGDVRMEGDTLSNLFFLDASADKIGIGTTTPFSTLSLESQAGVTPFTIGSSTATLFAVKDDGKIGIGTTDFQKNINVQGTGSTTLYMTSTSTSAVGASIILEDTDGAGCSEISVLNGVISIGVVTCP